MVKYDSIKDTKKHIKTVGGYIDRFINGLKIRAKNHDKTKLSSDEKPYFDIYTPKLKNCTYGSDEYKKYLKELNVALEHHYKNNRHHPEHHKEGINGMRLLDIVEMLCDWKSATLRHNDGDLIKSIDINQERFGYDDNLKNIMLNEAKYMYKYTIEWYCSDGRYGTYLGDIEGDLFLKIEQDDKITDIEKRYLKFGQCNQRKDIKFKDGWDTIDNGFSITWKVNY